MQRTLISLTLVCMITSQTTALAQPHVEGLSAGQAANSLVPGLLKEDSARQVVPGYTQDAPQSAYYGASNLADPAREQLANCATSPENPFCQAQQGAVSSAQLPRDPVSPNDPGIRESQDIARNPGLVLTELGDYYAGCEAGLPCPGNVSCLGGNCYNTQYSPDPDFARSMALLEAAREAGVYLDTANLQVFQGENNRCRHRLFKNCCQTQGSGAGMSNQGVMGIGSRLVFDLLMKSSNRQFVIQGLQALLMGSGFSGSFTSYGVTLALNGASVPVGSTVVASGPNFVVAFNPWALVIVVLIYMVMSLMSCNKDEGMLAMKEGAQLCRSLGSWCSECIKVFGKCVTCIERSTGKCCFNSRLALMINEQGRAQIGKGWGSAKRPDCSGFSVDQLQRLNFAAMDLSGFYRYLVPTLPDAGALRAQSAGRLEDCYYGQGQCQ